MTRKRRGLALAPRREDDEAAAEAPLPRRGPTAGRLVDVTPEGRLLVSWGEPPGPPKPAWIAAEAPARALLAAVERRGAVLLDFLDGDPGRPVILALLRERLDVDAAEPGAAIEHRIELRASEDLTLECGDSAIHLSRDGRVTIRGTHVESLSTGQNRIKGASVGIN